MVRLFAINPGILKHLQLLLPILQARQNLTKKSDLALDIWTKGQYIITVLIQ